MQNKAAIYGILLFVGATILFFLGFSLLNNPRTQKTPKTAVIPSTNPLPTQQTTDGTNFASPNSLYSPIAKNSKLLVQTLIIYTFKGTATSIAPHPKGYELFTDIELENVPPFIICLTCEQPTEIFFYDLSTNKRTPTTVSSLKENQKLYIVAGYNIKGKGWGISRVLILDSPTATATATPNPESP